MQRHSPLLRIAATLGAGAILLTACGSDADTPVASSTQDAGLPAEDDQAAGGASGTRPADVEFTSQERADMLFGTTQAEAETLALEFGWTVRVGRIDDEAYALTEDYMIDRMTLELDTDQDGEPVVTKVLIELDGGVQEFTA